MGKKGNKRNINMTYQSYDEYKNLNSTDFLMLCEFLDNSISSFINKSEGKYKNLEGCKINIIFDRSNDLNKQLIIEDNAQGLTSKTLNTCFEIGHSDDKKPDSDLNAFGIGMKQAGFYLGQMLKITTRNLEYEKVLCSYIDVKNNQKNKPVEVSIDELDDSELETKSGDKFETGSIVQVSYLRKNIFTKSVIDKMVTLLGSRYYNYIYNGLELNVAVLNTKKDDLEFKQISKTRFPYENVTNYFTEENYLGTDLEVLRSKITEVINQTYDKYQGETKIKDDLIFKVANNNDFKWDFEEEIIDGIKIKGEIGWLANSKKTDFSFVKTFGFNLFQGGRAIYSSPSPQSTDNDNLHVGTYKSELFPAELSGGKGHLRRWVGYFDVSELVNKKDEFGEYQYWKPDSNKRGLRWVDESAKENFKKILKGFMEKYDSYLKNIIDLLSATVKKKNKASSKKVKEILKGDLKDESILNIKSVSDVGSSFGLLKNDESEISVESIIFSENDNPTKDFVSYNANIDEESIEIRINPSNPIWTPLVGHEDDINDDASAYYHKFGLVFGLTQLYLDQPNMECKLFELLNNNEEIVWARNAPNFIILVSKIAKYIFKEL